MTYFYKEIRVDDDGSTVFALRRDTAPEEISTETLLFSVKMTPVDGTQSSAEPLWTLCKEDQIQVNNAVLTYEHGVRNARTEGARANAGQSGKSKRKARTSSRSAAAAGAGAGAGADGKRKASASRPRTSRPRTRADGKRPSSNGRSVRRSKRCRSGAAAGESSEDEAGGEETSCEEMAASSDTETGAFAFGVPKGGWN